MNHERVPTDRPSNADHGGDRAYPFQGIPTAQDVLSYIESAGDRAYHYDAEGRPSSRRALLNRAWAWAQELDGSLDVIHREASQLAVKVTLVSAARHDTDFSNLRELGARGARIEVLIASYEERRRFFGDWLREQGLL